MKITFTTLILFTATSLFAGTNYKYKGLSPLNGDECAVEVNIFDNLTLAYISINGAYSVQDIPSQVETNDYGLVYNYFDELHLGIANGLAQTPTFSSKRMLFKTKDLLDLSHVIEFKGKNLAEAKSVSFKESHFVFKRISSGCNDLELISTDEWNPKTDIE